ncbi:MAG: FtsQ-type POTRA domain-containing protein [Anaerolineae bacterium]|nr:MAG: FtsQ-type POTRA domain-containing protein [Anaerolineae bacterium]
MREDKHPLTRAERVRARRQQRKRTPAKPVAAVQPVRSELPPVLVRRDRSESRWTRPGRRKRLRRRLDFALPSPGLEVRLPALPLIRPGWRALSAAVALTAAVLVYLLWALPAFRVQQVRVEGARYIAPQQIIASMLVLNRPVVALDPLQLEERLLSMFDAFEDVSVWVGFPAQVVVQVRERQPVLIWEVDGETLFVDENGNRFGGVQVQADLPRVQAAVLPPAPVEASVLAEAEPLVGEAAAESIPQAVMSPQMVEAVVWLAGQLPPGVDLTYDAGHGFGWWDPRGWQVFFGDATDAQMKIAIYSAVVAELQRRGIQPSVISVEFPHAPYYR